MRMPGGKNALPHSDRKRIFAGESVQPLCQFFNRTFTPLKLPKKSRVFHGG